MTVHCETRNCSACGREISREYYEAHGGVCCECIEDAREKRTHLSFLANNEAAQESKRTEEMVRDLVDTKPRNLFKPKHICRVGETDSFLVDLDDKGLVIVYGKEILAECRFKLVFDRSELGKIIELLKKAHDLA